MVSDPFVSEPNGVIFLKPAFLIPSQWEGVVSMMNHERGITRVRVQELAPMFD